MGGGHAFKHKPHFLDLLQNAWEKKNRCSWWFQLSTHLKNVSQTSRGENNKYLKPPPRDILFNGGLMVMNPMVRFVKNKTPNKSRTLFRVK